MDVRISAVVTLTGLMMGAVTLWAPVQQQEGICGQGSVGLPWFPYQPTHRWPNEFRDHGPPTRKWISWPLGGWHYPVHEAVPGGGSYGYLARDRVRWQRLGLELAMVAAIGALGGMTIRLRDRRQAAGTST